MPCNQRVCGLFSVELEIKNAHKFFFGTIAKTSNGFLFGQICAVRVCLCVQVVFVAGAISEQMTNGIN